MKYIRTKTFFTLIELLVVAAIITIVGLFTLGILGAGGSFAYQALTEDDPVKIENTSKEAK